MRLFAPVFQALHDHGVDYVVVGGVAVVIHGHQRLTTDIDLVIGFGGDNAAKVIQALVALGLQPRIPVPATQFADADKRTEWINEKNMIVFSLADPSNPFISVDLFLDPPVCFEDLRRRAVVKKFEGVDVVVCSREDLIRLKKISGRQLDQDDIKALEDGKSG